MSSVRTSSAERRRDTRLCSIWRRLSSLIALGPFVFHLRTTFSISTIPLGGANVRAMLHQSIKSSLIILKSTIIISAIAIILFTVLLITELSRDSARWGTSRPPDRCQLLAFCYGPCSASPRRPSCHKDKGLLSKDPTCQKNCVCQNICG
ncbi:hypothetical protein F4802DRAFT_565450 [Xylaria palmicola]|nr:hypothetical protein F4802DRAFT_565450 [Xylaria palmicola]